LWWALLSAQGQADWKQAVRRRLALLALLALVRRLQVQVLVRRTLVQARRLLVLALVRRLPVRVPVRLPVRVPVRVQALVQALVQVQVPVPVQVQVPVRRPAWAPLALQLVQLVQLAWAPLAR
jgi:hypothetical protein